MVFQRQTEKRNRFKTLILENCLLFGQHPKFTNKKTIKYLLGTRKELEVFKIKELEHILLKMYPLIYTLFKNVRKNLKFEKHVFKGQKVMKSPKTLRPAKQIAPNFPLLFATNTDSYLNITKAAAATCQMFNYNNNIRSLQHLSSTTFQPKVVKKINKLHIAASSMQLILKKNYTENNFNNRIQRANQNYKKPGLIVIPDVEKSINLIKGIHNMGIPIIGLINSNTNSSIDYPVFGNANSIHVVHFFCHLLAKLVLKATNNIQRSQVLPTFFTKTKDNTNVILKQRQKKYHFYDASCKYKMVENNSTTSDIITDKKVKELLWPRQLCYRFLIFKKTKFWARAVNLQLIEAKHKKIRVLLKVVQELTEKQFLNTYDQFAWILRSTYLAFFNFQTTLLKMPKNLLAKKNSRLLNKFNVFFHIARAKYNYANSKLWTTWNLEQWQLQIRTAINSTYYWRRPSFYRELPWFFLRDMSLKDRETTPLLKKNRKRFERWRKVSKYKVKKPFQKKEVLKNVKTVYSIVDVKTQMRHKIKKMVTKNKIKNSTNHIKKWKLRKRIWVKQRT